MAFVSFSGFLTGRRYQVGCDSQIRIASGRSVRAARISMVAKKTPNFNPNKMPKEKVKLDPEEVVMDVSPSPTELIVPFISILTVVGIIPFIAAVARQLWVRYKVTSRRISVSGGFQGKDTVEIIYRDIQQVRYAKRLGGSADMVLLLKDGAKLELRFVPEFQRIFDYIMTQVDEEARESSGFAGEKPEVS